MVPLVPDTASASSTAACMLDDLHCIRATSSLCCRWSTLAPAGWSSMAALADALFWTFMPASQATVVFMPSIADPKHTCPAQGWGRNSISGHIDAGRDFGNNNEWDFGSDGYGTPPPPFSLRLEDKGKDATGSPGPCRCANMAV